ncbi:GlxA family transcriptional regulator [Yunchengibacter salinarum]|uniref:GlxA family transcriptional regulator n=1 Tax=Yunchengibacter salinarum TaxID=3133399 RepID=UPI0035B679FC
MFGPRPRHAHNRMVSRKVAFLLVPNFSMMAFASSVEPLRAANRLADKTLYEWCTISLDGRPVQASNEVSVTPASRLSDMSADYIPIVCAGVRARDYTDRRILDWLRDMARRRLSLGAVCTGTLFLARAGLLDGYRCTIHWENVEALAEEFPDLNITATLFETDRDRFTCSGGTAPLDMMTYAIADHHGADLAKAVSEEMVHGVQRQPTNPQRMDLGYRTGQSHPKILAAIAFMEAYLETPQPISAVADQVGTTERTLARLFRDHLGIKPSRYYLSLRLQRARQLLRQTDMSILQVAVACGFTSSAHFARCYKEQFANSPRVDRARPRPSIGGPAAPDTTSAPTEPGTA